jgi:NADH-quinone oxidoreductase subunit A
MFVLQQTLQTLHTVPADWIPIFVQFCCGAAFVILSLGAIRFTGPSVKGKLKDETFECGIPAVGNARQPWSVKYFLVAILFVLFDVEVIFLYPWAVNFKELGMAGLVEMTIFVFFFMFGFYYILRKGVLDWK